MALIIYTDGGASSKDKVGGCSAIICNDDIVIKRLTAAYPDVTNNQMEIYGAILGLSYILDNPELGTIVKVIADSEYVVLGASLWITNWKRNGWRTKDKKPVKNKVLWETMDCFMDKLKITWEWTKGHAGNPLNEEADSLAVQAYKDLL